MMEEKQNTERKETKKSKKKVAIIIVVAVIALVVTLLCLNYANDVAESKTLERETAAEMGIMPGMSEEEIRDRLNRKVAESMLNVSFNPTPVVQDGKMDIAIENIPGNNYSFTVTVTRVDNNEVILETGVIDPGYYVRDISMDKKLAAGEYICVATFTAYDPKTLDEIGETGAQMVVTVK